MSGKNVIIGQFEGKLAAAFIENGELLEFIIDRDSEVQVGNIYRSRVVDVLNKMNTVFADIGDGNIVYLQGDSLNYKPGNVVMLQIKKEAYSTKFPTATTKCSISGRYAVCFHNSSYIGVSKKILDKQESRRLLKIAKKNVPENMGVIIRTAAEGIPENIISKEISILAKKLNEIVEKGTTDGPCEAVYKDRFFPDKILRDKIDEDTNSIIIEGIEIYNQFYDYMRAYERSDIRKLKLHTGEFDVFTVYDVTSQIKRALSRKVWLPCGGFLIFDKTEALTVIDVNTGKFSGSRDIKESILKVNMEAAKEIARQLRLRDIGGIIIVDFIDMKDQENKDKLINYLEEEVSKDKSKTIVFGMTKLGLVEITRKRTGEGLIEVFNKNDELKKYME